MTTQHHGLKRELKLQDLVMMQWLLVVALNFTGYAAKQGPSQIVLWTLAILLFYLPLAAIVIQLSRAIPLEGGVYQWVKVGISPFAGFMAAWSLTIYAISFLASYGSQMADGIAYASGSSGMWMSTSKPFSFATTILICLLALLVNVSGLRLAKWLGSIGGLLTIAIFLVLAFLLAKVWFIRPFSSASPATLGPSGAFAFAWPALSIATLNVFTKMALFSLSGFDQCAVFCEECRKPKNDVARSVLISAPLIALMYILVTSTVLAHIPIAKVDVAAPVSQVLQAGFGPTTIGRILTAAAVSGFNVMLLATLVILVGIVARLPMVAGWDGILPAWWSELHPRFRTPTKAIAAVTVGLILMGGLSLLGAANQEAVQVLEAAGFGSYCIMYLLLFGQVLFGFRSRNSTVTWRPSLQLRIGALAAFLVVAISLVFELIPLGEVASPAIFALKVTLAICATNGLGAFLYWRGAKRIKGLPLPSES
jgi:amino acid transporter